MRISMVSEHASPLAALGGVDAGGQNVHVAALAEALARRGAQVVVHTRRDDPAAPERVEMAPGVVVHHVDAGPPRPIPKDELLPYMDGFAERLVEAWRSDRPDVVHAHFWMSGHAALRATTTPRRRSASGSSATSSVALTRSSPRAPTRSSSSCAWAPPAAS